MSARERVSFSCKLLLALLSLALTLCKDTLQKELHCTEAVILAKITEAANVDPNALLDEIGRLQKKPAGHYEGRCTENFAWWVYSIQHHIQSPALERKIKQVLEESGELVSEIEKLQPGVAGVFHRGYVSEYEMPHRIYFNTSARDNKGLATLRRDCLVIIAETFHRRYEGRDIFSEEDFQECKSPQSRLEEAVGRLSEYMSEFARNEDSTHLIRDLVRIELEYRRRSTGHE